MIIKESLGLGRCHNSMIRFYISISFLSLDDFLLFACYTCKRQCDVIFNWIPCTVNLNYILLAAAYCWLLSLLH